MHTEEQAREKWCPHVRISASDGPCEGNHAANIGADLNPLGRCIASDCMAWRWDDAGEHVPVPHGFCGLATEPKP